MKIKEFRLRNISYCNKCGLEINENGSQSVELEDGTELDFHKDCYAEINKCAAKSKSFDWDAYKSPPKHISSKIAVETIAMKGDRVIVLNYRKRPADWETATVTKPTTSPSWWVGKGCRQMTTLVRPDFKTFVIAFNILVLNVLLN